MKKNQNILSALLVTTALFTSQMASAKVCTGMGQLNENGKKSNVFVLALLEERTAGQFGNVLIGTDASVFIQRIAKPIKGLFDIEVKSLKATANSNSRTKLGVKVGKTNYEYAFTTKKSNIRETYGSGTTTVLIDDVETLKLTRTVVPQIAGTVEVEDVAINISSGKNSITSAKLACQKL